MKAHYWRQKRAETKKKQSASRIHIRETTRKRGERMRWVFGLMWIVGSAVLAVTKGGDAVTAAMMAGAGEAVSL